MSKKRNIANNRRRKTSERLRDIEVSSAEFFAGPLPTPEKLADYNSIHPSFAERIFVMAELEQEKDIFIQKKKASMGFYLTFFGLVCAVITVIGILYIAYLCVDARLEDAIKWIFICAAGIIGVFVLKQRKKD